MKLSIRSVDKLALLASTRLSTSNANAQQCVEGGFIVEFRGTCNYDTLLSAYTDQVYGVSGATNEATCGLTPKESFDSKLSRALTTAEQLCASIYDEAKVVPFSDATNKGDHLHFEQHFFNGRTTWQEEVETKYETVDKSPTSILKEDAEAVRAFYEGTAQRYRVEWPGSLTNFQSEVLDADNLETCSTNAAMCCWPQDRQANDNNGNCGSAYDINCVDKDPADNTDLCFVNLNKGNYSNEFRSQQGSIIFPGDNDNGEGAIHCHGLAWANDVRDATARYKANNLFYVSMYDHMYTRGYVGNVPGAPMCACVEQMPTVSRSDCTQVDVTESIKIVFDHKTNRLTGKITSIDVKYNACQGIDNRNNDLWAYIARLYFQGDISAEQFGKAGRIITDQDCETAIDFKLNQQGLTRGYDHDRSVWTKVAGRDILYSDHPFGKEAFYSSFFVHSLTAPSDPTTAPFDKTPILKRVCATCLESHTHIYYRRLTPIVSDNFDLLDNLLYQRNDGDGDNVWNEDFTIHSTYEDAITGSNPWKCPSDKYIYGASFPGDCSPDGKSVRYQGSRFPYYGKTDVAWYVNKPEDHGIKTYDSDDRDARFTDVDIGPLQKPGRTFEAEDGTYHITSTGRMESQQDAFRFLSEPKSGDVQVDVHLVHFDGPRYGKAGIMIRSDNSDDSEFVFASMYGDSVINMKVRSSKGGKTITVGDTDNEFSTNNSAWFRLTKKMDVVEMWKSIDGVSWTFHSSSFILFPNDSFRVGMAVNAADDTDMADATFQYFDVSTYNAPTSAPSISSAPTMWTPSIDIGNVQIPGSYTPEDPSSGITVLEGSGTGTWGRHDSLFFNGEKMPVDSNFTAECFVYYFGTNYEFSKGGIMVRDGNDSDAANAFISITGHSQGVAFQSRKASGAHTDHHSLNWVDDNKIWLKLVKFGNTFSAFYMHEDQTEYTHAGDTELDLTGNTVVVGLAVTAGTDNQYAETKIQVKNYSVKDNIVRRLRASRV